MGITHVSTNDIGPVHVSHGGAAQSGAQVGQTELLRRSRSKPFSFFSDGCLHKLENCQCAVLRRFREVAKLNPSGGSSQAKCSRHAVKKKLETV